MYDARCKRSYNCTHKHTHTSIHSQDTFHISYFNDCIVNEAATKTQSLLGVHLKRTGHRRLHKLILGELPVAISCSLQISSHTKTICKFAIFLFFSFAALAQTKNYV